MDKEQYTGITANNSFIKLDKMNKVFSFNLQSKDGHAKGYCALSKSEYEAFENVFLIIVNNVERVD